MKTTFGALRFLSACLLVLAGQRQVFAQTQVDDYVILAREELQIKRAGLLASGNVGVSDQGGEAKLGARVLALDGTNVLADEAIVRKASSFYRFWANTAALGKGVVFRDTTLHPDPETPLPFPPPAVSSMPSLPSVLPGPSDLDVPATDHDYPAAGELRAIATAAVGRGRIHGRGLPLRSNSGSSRIPIAVRGPYDGQCRQPGTAAVPVWWWDRSSPR
ncbi:MAG: hypothetical protein KatS3mg076_1030 [Candidatus Binatia bacterium]|nr:MAG: hypothetical protein KatS3mg076_1030 [Candidatus Binatia bacterium]